MARQFNPSAAICTSIFFFLAFTATIFAQTAANRTMRGRNTPPRRVASDQMASLEQRPAFTPVVIYYSRDGAEVAKERPSRTEKANTGVGESITIYYGRDKSTTGLPQVSRPKNTRLTNNVAKQLPQEPSQPPITPASDTSRGSAANSPAIDTAAVTDRADSKSPRADPVAAVAEPAEVKRAPDETAKAVDDRVTEAKTDPAQIATSNPSNPGGEPLARDPSKTETPAQTVSVDTKPPAEAAPIKTAGVDTPAAETSPAAETKTETKSVVENNRGTDAAGPPPVPSSDVPPPPPVSNPPADAKPATETTSDSKVPATGLPTAARDAVSLNNAAVQATREYRFADAAALLRSAIESKPNSYKLHRNLSIVYEKMNRMEMAVTSAESAVKLAPNEPSAVSQLCNVQLQINKYDEACQCYESLKKLAPLDSVAETSYGVAMLRSGKTREAVAMLEKTANTTPVSSDTLNALGVAYFDDKRFTDSIAVFKRAVELNPDELGLRFNLGIAYIASGNKEGAVSQYKILKEQDAKLASQLHLILFRDKVVSVDELRHR